MGGAVVVVVCSWVVGVSAAFDEDPPHAARVIVAIATKSIVAMGRLLLDRGVIGSPETMSMDSQSRALVGGSAVACRSHC